MAAEFDVGAVAAEILRRKPIRKIALKIAEGETKKYYIMKNPDEYPVKIQEDKYKMFTNLINVLDKGVSKGLISKKVWRRFLKAFASMIIKGRRIREEFERRYGAEPPIFLTLSPTDACNLNCKGCYASSEPRRRKHIEWEIAHRILTEKGKLWGSYFTNISGGEPFLWRSDGKNILRLFEAHADNLFMVYTNGTLISKRLARDLADLGNITPAISVEGLERETDERRGKGTFSKILDAFENLREEGVPFGVSLTATKHNADVVLSDEVVNFYFENQGALYMWVFHYMPIGKDYTLELQPTPEQRIKMHQKAFEYIRKGYFLADFWNCGSVTTGCISAGIYKGYLHINWNGDVSPCVFIPYYVDNIKDIYAKGGTLNDVLFSKFFRRLQDWRFEYAKGRKRGSMGNLIRPCPIRDHHSFIISLLKDVSAKPIDESAQEAMNDKTYHRKLIEYGEHFGRLSEPMWEKLYLEGEPSVPQDISISKLCSCCAGKFAEFLPESVSRKL